MSEFDFYPEKPPLKIKEKKSRLDLTIFTMVLFVLSFLLIFSEGFSLIMMLLAVLIIHELGHYSFMKFFKYKNVRMMFVPLMGAFVQGLKERYSQKESFLVVLAGPMPGILLGIAGFLLANDWQNPYVMTISFIFIALNVVNLFPLDPLDGGQLLKLLIGKNQDYFQMIFSLTSSLVMIGIGIYTDSYMIIAFGFLMSFRVRNLQRSYTMRKEMKEEGINFNSTYADLSNKDYSRIKTILLKNNKALEKFVEMRSEDEEIEPVLASQVQSILEPPLALDASVFQRVLVVLAWILCFVGPIVFFLLSDFDLTWYFKDVQYWR